MVIPTVQTAHLTLRPLYMADAETLYRIYRTDGVLDYFPSPTPPPLEKVQRFIANQQTHWEQHGCGNWGVVPEQAAEIAGWAGLQFLPETGETEVGFLLDRPYWGKGYATEAGRASLEFAFANVAVERVIALVHPDNRASQRVIEKCGLAFVDQQVYFGMDLLRYRIERPEKSG